MAKETRKLEPRILILFLILGIVPPVAGHFILVSGARELYLEYAGAHLSQRAEDIQRELASLIEGSILQVSNLAASQSVRDFVESQDRDQPDADRLEQSVTRLEQNWAGLTPSDSPLREILDNPIAQLFRQINEINPTFREILLTDRLGRLVAATNKTSDYYQADEAWWQRAALQGQGARYVGDIAFDESANTYGMEIAEPIRDSDTRSVIGVIKAILDSPALFARLEAANEDPTEETLLVRPDGSVIWSPDARTSYAFSDSLNEALNLGRPSLETTGRDGEQVLVGIPSFGIKHRIPELDWYVLVRSRYSQLLVPFEDVNRRFLLIVAATLVVVVVLALIFTHFLSKPVVEIDPHFERLETK